MVSMSRYEEEEIIPGTFTPRGEDKGWLGNQIDAFTHMNALGADVFESAIAAFSGHRMTPELAASCIATYWRRYTAICNFQESRGAAITVQASLQADSTCSLRTAFSSLAACREHQPAALSGSEPEHKIQRPLPRILHTRAIATRAARACTRPCRLQKIRSRQVLAQRTRCLRMLLPCRFCMRLGARAVDSRSPPSLSLPSGGPPRP